MNGRAAIFQKYKFGFPKIQVFGRKKYRRSKETSSFQADRDTAQRRIFPENPENELI